MARGLWLRAAAMAGMGLLVVSSAAREPRINGQLTLRTGHENIATDSLRFPLAGDSAWDASAELRLNAEVPANRRDRFTIHYEAIVRKQEWDPDRIGAAGPLTGGAVPDDRRRFFDLTRTLHEKNGEVAYHRLDRLVWEGSAEWGTLAVGRTAVTWGNGLVFNPMDLFNPFAPTDVERDYKQGDDMVHLTLVPADWNGNLGWQLLLVPRRDAAGGDPVMSESSVALKTHFFTGDSEWNLLAAWHYDEAVLGIGHTGYLGDAVWRADATLAFAEDGSAVFSGVVNLDRSWTWKEMNGYGSLEFHYNTYGTGDYGGLDREEALLERLSRGGIHTLGRAYLASSLRVELHPLLNAYLTSLANLEDPSAVLLPRLVWNVRQDLDLTLGGSLPLGGRGTEFGGLPVPGTRRFLKAPDRLYFWVKGYF